MTAKPILAQMFGLKNINTQQQVADQGISNEGMRVFSNQ